MELQAPSTACLVSVAHLHAASSPTVPLLAYALRSVHRAIHAKQHDNAAQLQHAVYAVRHCLHAGRSEAKLPSVLMPSIQILHDSFSGLPLVQYALQDIHVMTDSLDCSKYASGRLCWNTRRPPGPHCCSGQFPLVGLLSACAV